MQHESFFHTKFFKCNIDFFFLGGVENGWQSFLYVRNVASSFCNSWKICIVKTTATTTRGTRRDKDEKFFVVFLVEYRHTHGREIIILPFFVVPEVNFRCVCVCFQVFHFCV